MTISTDPYVAHWDNIIQNGYQASPRGEQTIEVLNAQMTFQAGYLPRREKMNEALGFMELMQFISGRFSVDNIAKVAPNADLKLFEKQSDYGPRTTNQLAHIVKGMNDDPETRRAVFFFSSGNEMVSDELPCTTTGQLILRADALHTTFNMRSSDAAYGVPYDIMMFGGLTIALARALGTKAGYVTINFASAHIYQKTRTLRPKPSNAHFYMTNNAPQDWFRIKELCELNVDLAPWPVGEPPVGWEVASV